MGTVLCETKNKFSEIGFDTIYVEIMTDITNHYKIKKNPTVLFLDEQSNELYRMEGFIETEKMIETIEKLNVNVLQSSEKYEDNQEIIENYTIYLYKNKDLVPLEIQHNNITSVQAPRITAINVLIKAEIEGYENPFHLLSSKLEHVNFDQNRAYVIIYIHADEIDKSTRNKMECALTTTLSQFGIKGVKLTIINEENE